MGWGLAMTAPRWLLALDFGGTKLSAALVEMRKVKYDDEGVLPHSHTPILLLLPQFIGMR